MRRIISYLKEFGKKTKQNTLTTNIVERKILYLNRTQKK